SSTLNPDPEPRMRDSASVTAMFATLSRRAVSPGGGGRNATIGRRAVAGWGPRALRPSLAGAGHLPLSLEPARTASKKTPRCRHADSTFADTTMKTIPNEEYATARRTTGKYALFLARSHSGLPSRAESPSSS
ncbi:MAG: hypothetical protein MK358_11425, partial [Vicinamibacterales bacterium]|nr:hypothetical protein [Vicinamibacterales bacterium]